MTPLSATTPACAGRRHEPSGRRSTVRSVLVRDLTDGQEVDQVLLVRTAEVRRRRDGTEVLRLELGDRTGRVVAVVRDDVAAVRERCRAGAVVRITGRHERHPRYGAQIVVDDVAEAPAGSYAPADLLDGPPVSAETMEADLRDLVATVQDRHLRALLDALLGPRTDTWQRYRRAPAAKLFHQAYAHGLLEHSLTVAQGVSAMAATFPGIDRDVAVTGALLHDIGKLEAYAGEGHAIDMTDDGKLLGEIPLGYYRVRRAIEDLPGFPPHLAQAVLHIVLSHHGALEYGSPVVPCTREATLVHFIDNLGGRLGSFDRLEKELAPGAAWSPFDRALGGGAYFGPVAAGRERDAA
jgi:3'-5' exoribonuclease